MKHLERHSRKKTTRNLLFIIIALVVLVYLIFTAGINALLGTASLIARLTNKNQPDLSLSKKPDFYGNIDITDIPTATNSSSIRVAGTVNNYDIIQFFVNDNKVDEISVSDNFEQQINNLKDGTNQLYLIAKSKNTKSTQKTTTYSITVKKNPPSLEISDPKDGSKLSKDEIIVVGQTDKEVVININELPVVVNALGGFQSTVKLQSGENKITVTAQDIAGNIASKTITVTYQKD